MAATSTDLKKDVEYKADGLKYHVDFDITNNTVSLKNLAGEIILSEMTKHDLGYFLEIITKVKTDADTLFV